MILPRTTKTTVEVVADRFDVDDHGLHLSLEIIEQDGMPPIRVYIEGPHSDYEQFFTLEELVDLLDPHGIVDQVDYRARENNDDGHYTDYPA